MRDPFLLEAPHAIHFSGGLTSAYMLRRHLDTHGGTLPDGARVIFCNTGKERAETLDFVERCSLEWSVPVTWLEYRYHPGRPGDPGTQVGKVVRVEGGIDDDGEPYPPGVSLQVETVGRKSPSGKHGFEVVNYATASRNGEPFGQVIQARGFLPNVVARFCTVELKIRTAQRYLRSLGWAKWTSSIGLRADEPDRVARLVETNRHNNERPVAPLDDADVGLAEVRAFWAAQPFTLPLAPHEGNCDLCFLKGRGKIAAIMRDRPDLAEWWIGQENSIRLSRSARNEAFRADRPRYEVMLRQVQEQPLLPMFDDDAVVDCFCGDGA